MVPRTVNGPAWLTGGQFGIEASLALALLTSVSVWLMLASPVPDPDLQAERREQRREFASRVGAELGEPAA